VSEIEDIAPLWVAVIMRKKSELYDKVNIAVTSRLETLQKPLKPNITKECWHHFYEPATTSGLAFEPISISVTGGLFLIFTIMTFFCWHFYF